MANNTEPGWYKIADDLNEICFNANGLAEINVNGKTVCLALHNSRLAACTPKCPHAGAVLSDGKIDSLGNLVCPLHKYRFSLKNGTNTSGEGYHLKTFKIEERADGVFILLTNANSPG